MLDRAQRQSTFYTDSSVKNSSIPECLDSTKTDNFSTALATNHKQQKNAIFVVEIFILEEETIALLKVKLATTSEKWNIFNVYVKVCPQKVLQ